MALIPIGDIPALRQAGVHYPSTPESWRWLYRTRAERGVAEAFLRCGRRILGSAGINRHRVEDERASH